LAIYSYTVNAGCPLEETLADSFPLVRRVGKAELKRLFARLFVAAKQRDNVLDYDDLLLYWREAVQMPGISAQKWRADFDHILVDELSGHEPAASRDPSRAGARWRRGSTVVGDDAQSIYAFRARDGAEHSRFSRSVLTASGGNFARGTTIVRPNLFSTLPTRSSPRPEKVSPRR